MVTAWSSWRFKPDCVVVESERGASRLGRLRARVRDNGLGWAVGRLRRRSATAPAAVGDALEAVEFCRQAGIPFVTVPSVNEPGALERIASLKPALAIHAGAGLLRSPLLAIPTLGTVNAHMGILPRYRGMNVAEWARLNGDPVGCSVHRIDPGIDTGEIVCVRRVDTAGCRTIAQLRETVDRAQIALLGQVVRTILETGAIPGGRTQAPREGIQFFRMHPELAAVLEREMAEASAARAPHDERDCLTASAP
jgi:methionyl-tRNA formyltransferase